MPLAHPPIHRSSHPRSIHPPTHPSIHPPTTGVIADRKKFFHEAVVDETATPDDALDKFQIFEKWLLDNGAAFPQLYVRRPEEKGEEKGEEKCEEKGEEKESWGEREGGDDDDDGDDDDNGGFVVCGRTFKACSRCSFERAGHPNCVPCISEYEQYVSYPPLRLSLSPLSLPRLSRVSPRISPASPA